MGKRTDNVIQLQRHPGGVAPGIRSVLHAGRTEIVTVGPNNPEFSFIGSDPWTTNAGTGLVVPSAPSASIGNERYLFMLAMMSFGGGEQSSDFLGTRLVGIRQYADLIARIPPGGEDSPVENATTTTVFRKEIVSPLWHPPDGNISWHVMIVPKGYRDTRNPANTDGLIYQTSMSPALLFETLGPYTPPNGGRPWGRPLAASLGNIHELRYPWRTERSEVVLDIPITVPSDVALFASVRQNDPATNPVLSDDTVSQQFAALSPEDQFLTAYSAYAQYGVIAGALVFEQNIGEDVP